MEIGNQYRPDDKFKAAARLHQSKYRAEVLRVDYEEYGNRLNDEDAQMLLNYYDKLNSRAVLRNRYPSYSKMRDADMLRSEHIPFNLLAPLETNQTKAIEIIKRAFGIDCIAIDFVGMEYAPTPRDYYLNDGTSFDTYIEVTVSSREKIGIGIEVKFTEQDYRIGKTEKTHIEDHESPYWKTARASLCFNNPDDEIFGSDPLRQIWRNHLLGLSMIEHEDIDKFYSITLFPNGNEHFHEKLPRYTSLLKDDKKQYVFGCTFEKYIASISGTPEFTEWREWLERRYIVK
ncbi:MAG: PGN_0703 family putative restriction endonuclease [Candidatus Thorarchaeota archaeon]